MAKPLSVSEATAIHGTAVADLHHPIIPQQEGQPLAVIVTFDEHQHWRDLAADEAERRLAGWRSLELLLVEVYRRPSDYTSEQIEAEISAAWTEVRKAQHNRRRGHWHQGNATYVVSRDEDLTRDLDLNDRLREQGIETIAVQRLLDRLRLSIAE